MADIKHYALQSGRKIKEDNSFVNLADLIDQLHKALVTDKNAGVQLTGSKTTDNGLVVEGLNMAAGATVYGNWIDNLSWVRNFVLLSGSDQQYEILLQRRDTTLVQDGGAILAGGLSPLGSNYRSNIFTPTNGSNVCSLTGYSARFGVRNSAAVPNTFARIRAQLLGL